MDVREIDLDQIKVVRNTRDVVKDDHLQELMGSIKSETLLNPLTVQKKGNSFELVAGHRRLAAIKKLGWASVNCNVITKKSGYDNKLTQLAENVHRKEILVSDLGFAVLDLMKKHNLNRGEIAARLSISRNKVNNAVEIARRIPVSFRDSVKASTTGKQMKRGTISQTTATAILNLRKQNHLSGAGVKTLLKECKANPRFSSSNIRTVGRMIEGGADLKGAIKSEKEMTFFMPKIFINKKDLAKLNRDFDGNLSKVAADAFYMVTGVKCSTK